MRNARCSTRGRYLAVGKDNIGKTIRLAGLAGDERHRKKEGNHYLHCFRNTANHTALTQGATKTIVLAAIFSLLVPAQASKSAKVMLCIPHRRSLPHTYPPAPSIPSQTFLIRSTKISKYHSCLLSRRSRPGCHRVRSPPPSPFLLVSPSRLMRDHAAYLSCHPATYVQFKKGP